MEDYRNALRHILFNGEEREDRTGVGTRSVFGISMEFNDIHREFPLLTGKRTHWKSIITELCWFLQGHTNVNYLNERGVSIWDEWADENGELGPIYGAQWRDFGGVDQIEELQWALAHDPFSRRHVVSAWNPAEIPDMALPPCHRSFQVYVSRDGHLDMLFDMRSADMFLGVPFNIASYAALAHILAAPIGAQPRKLRVNVGDAHIYSNHVDKAYELVNRHWPSLPRLSVNRQFGRAGAYEPQDFEIIGYNPMPAIPAPVAV